MHVRKTETWRFPVHFTTLVQWIPTGKLGAVCKILGSKDTTAGAHHGPGVRSPLYSLQSLIPQPDIQQSTNISSVMTTSPQQLPRNSEELQKDTSVSPFLWMGIALVKMGGKPLLGLYMCSSTLSFAVSATEHRKAIQQLVGRKGEKAGDVYFMFSLKISHKIQGY